MRVGIPDLRGNVATDPYLSAEEDLRAATRLHERALADGFRAALEAYYATNLRVPPAQARRFIAGTLAAADRARAVLAHWIGMSPGSPLPRSAVDVGCGTGPLLLALHEAGIEPIGVDVGLRWLVLAAARLRERGRSVPLLCAGATALPFGNGSVGVIASESLIENVPPASAVVAEARRVLAPGGRLWLTTANRNSLGRDPHLGLPFGGLLPRAVVSGIAARRGIVPPHRDLLTARTLRRLLAEQGLTDIRIAPSPLTEAQARGASAAVRAAVRVYREVSATGPGQAMLRVIGPSLSAVAATAEPARAPAHGS